MSKATLVAVCGLCAAGGSALAQVGSINGLHTIARYFNDRPGSNLVITNNYPNVYGIFEDNPGPGGFANGHMGAFSTDGGTTPYDFNYQDAFDVQMHLFLSTAPQNVGGEAGFKFNLFGIGHFGVLPHNGEIAAFGGILPFHNFGSVWQPNQSVRLRIIHTPGDGNGLPGGFTVPSTMEYMYNFGQGWISSGPVAFSNLEGGIPDIPGNPLYMGPGVQNNWGAGLTMSEALFENVRINVPAPGLAVLGVGVGLLASRRRRA